MLPTTDKSYLQTNKRAGACTKLYIPVKLTDRRNLLKGKLQVNKGLYRQVEVPAREKKSGKMELWE